jgi:hypothetical protein
MKPLFVVLTVLLAALSAAGAAVVAVRLSVPGGLGPEVAAAVPPGAPGALDPAADPAGLESLRDELQVLSQRVVDLERELSMLRDERARRPAEVTEEPTAGAQALAGAEFDAGERAAIVRILEEERDLELQRREEERLQREEDLILARAERIATEIGLSAADQKTLTDHMLVAAVKRREILKAAREEDFDRELMRDQFIELRDWNEKTLIDSFGPDLASQIQQVERGSRGGDRSPGRAAREPERGRSGTGGRGGRGSG